MNETRNELLGLLHYVKGEPKDKEFNLYYIINRFKIDLEKQLEHLENKKVEILNNLDLIIYIQNELEEENRFIKNDLEKYNKNENKEEN